MMQWRVSWGRLSHDAMEGELLGGLSHDAIESEFGRVGLSHDAMEGELGGYHMIQWRVSCWGGSIP